MEVRFAKEEDASRVREIYAPYIIDSSVSFEEEVPSVDDIACRIRSLHPTYPWLCCVDSSCNKVIGYAYVSKFRERVAYRWSVDVAIYIDKQYQGKGVASILYSRLFQIVRAQGFFNIYALIAEPNDLSFHLHRKFGFKHVATFTNPGYKAGQWRNVQWWEMILSPHTNPPLPPIPYTELDVSVVQQILKI
eukprot:TRINITY_DN1857_c0_g1_i1.p1 TRINITY_DN1857_c0_g1~~TRINITY_DN1857_c0_g1_i1.p1  ORF type:complete len:191 (-),score=40.48 TRINITY_DN1857_c0_g1_i1:12-584(-)